jgi:heterodisulfide reductase subunit C
VTPTGTSAAPATAAPATAAVAGAAPATIEITRMGGGLAREVLAMSGTSAMRCLQCAKCSSGCPVAGRGDLRSHDLVRLVQLDQREAALSSRFIWECTSCHTCITRCPQQVDIGAMNDALRVLSLREKLAPAATAVPVFNEAFLAGVRKRGRVHELGLMAVFKLRTKRFLEDMDKAPMMFRKRKLPLFGGRVAGRREREELFRRAAAGGAAARAGEAAAGEGGAGGAGSGAAGQGATGSTR